MAWLRTAVSAALLVAACSSPTVTAQPTGVIAATPTPVPQVTSPPTAAPTDTPIATLAVGQVDTEWGPIWATVPIDFPVVAGAQPTEADTVVSAAYTVPASSTMDARGVVNEYGRELAAASLGGGIDGPFEDGSYTAWASSGYGCDILITALPRGDAEIYVTVLYGALCRFDWPT